MFLKKAATKSESTKNLNQFDRFAIKRKQQQKLKGGTSENIPNPSQPNDFIIEVITDIG